MYIALCRMPFNFIKWGLRKGMRTWKHKYKCVCEVCGWLGRRTRLGIVSIPCPNCWPYLKGMTNQQKIDHINAIGKRWSTIKESETV